MQSFMRRHTLALLGVAVLVGSGAIVGTTIVRAAPQDPPNDHYAIFTNTLAFGPYGIGGAWCGAPTANTKDQHWEVVSGGFQFVDSSGNNNANSQDTLGNNSISGSWPHPDPLNPGWNIQAGPNGGTIETYVVCIKK